MKTILRIARKELNGFFASPAAFIFFGAFLAVNLFIFFWVETFFANNITEIRPLFSWMPILLIFLSGAITMRLWSEERRAGTLELLLTSPVRPFYLVAGKFLACMGLVGISLLLTLSIPITVSFMGQLDWGPVLGGYLATICLAGAYVAIGLFVSARSDNQIVSLIVTTLICGIFYLLGADTLTSFLGNRGSEVLRLLGSGSRFASITRGVIDLRDLYYYISLAGVFLGLNVYGLEKIRWAGNAANSHHRRWQAACVLLIANLLTPNFWLAPIGSLRADMTEGNIYSISDTTRNYLAGLREPLLIRGYFSAETHPLLAPLVPRLRDLLEEYAVAGDGKVRVEFIDPLENPELEQEAGEKYGIKPVPFQTTSKYQASVTNSYFDILINYGDQFEVLGFRDLIEVKARSEDDIVVELRNPEYDLTRSIKKVLYSYQGSGDLFATINRPVIFNGYFSPDRILPEQLVTFREEVRNILDELSQKSGGRFSVKIADPDGGDGKLAEKLSTDYGFRPMAASLFDTQTFWFYMTLASGDQVFEIPLPQDLSGASFERTLEAGLKRFAVGFTKTIALHSPPGTPPMPQYGIPGRGKRFNWLQESLSTEHTVVASDLKDGEVPAEADLLILAAPEDLDEKQLFAVDQFLMRGGTVIIATSPFDVSLEQGLSAEKYNSGLADWLAFNGLKIADEMVLDPSNSAFPIPIQRQVAGFIVQETRMVDYPYFVDIRPDGMNEDSSILAGLNQLTMNWASPIEIETGDKTDRKVTRLLESSHDSWTSPATDLQPNFDLYGQMGFAPSPEEERGRKLLGVAMEGEFDSYFKDRPSPLLAEEAIPAENGQAPSDMEQDKEPVISRMIDKSPDSARIILFSSNSFLTDTSLELGSAAMRSLYLAPTQLIVNSVDWSLEDRGLLAIRGRGHFSRPLEPMSKNEQMFWEYLNYGLALLGLLLIWVVRSISRKRTSMAYQLLLENNEGRA